MEFASSTASPAIPSTNAITINSGGALVDNSTVQGWLTNGKIRGSSNGAIALTSSSSDPSINFTNLAGGFPNLSLGALGSVTYGGTITPQGGYNFGGGGGTLFLTAALVGTNSVAVGNAGNITVILANSTDTLGATTIAAGATLQLGDGVANIATPVNSISNSGTLIFRNPLPQTFSGGISSPSSANLYALGTSSLTLNGTSSVGIFYPNGGTVNINGFFSTAGKTVFGSNLSIAPSSPTIVNWNATGSMNPSSAGPSSASPTRDEPPP